MSTALTPATAPEVRHALIRLSDVQVRETGSGDGSTLTLVGHAAVTDQETILYDGSWWRLREQIAPGAFTSVLARLRNPDPGDAAARTGVHLNIGHDMTRAIARTGVTGMGSLELSEDSVGLRVFARLNPVDPDVISLAAKMSCGIVDQMSFQFTVESDERTVTTDAEGREDELRTILEVRDLYDVTVCAQGAYATTDAALRARFQQFLTDPTIRVPDGAPANPVVTSPSAPAEPVVGHSSSHALAAAKARARVQRLRTTRR